MRLALTCLTLIAAPACATAGEIALATVPIGDLVLWYDANVWSVEKGGQTYAVHAVGAGPGDRPILIETAASRTCSREAMLETARIFHPNAWEYRVATIARPGFDLHVATLDMGCRNWTGSPVFACTALEERGYFMTANPGGCRNTPPNFDGPVMELMMGLAVP